MRRQSPLVTPSMRTVLVVSFLDVPSRAYPPVSEAPVYLPPWLENEGLVLVFWSGARASLRLERSFTNTPTLLSPLVGQAVTVTSTVAETPAGMPDRAGETICVRAPEEVVHTRRWPL